MKISASFICDLGKVREKNQDNLYFQGKVLKMRHTKAKSRILWRTSTKKAVCAGIFDGMGGEQWGEIASYLAAETLRNVMFEKKSGKIPKNILLEACKKANEQIYRKTLELHAERIGTTAAVIYMQYDRVWCCNVGDSRIYRLRDGKLLQLSADHVSQTDAGSSGLGEGRKKRKPGLTQHLGMKPEDAALLPYIVDERMETGDKYLICSDGLTDMVPLEEIAHILGKKATLQECNELLLNRALGYGGKDNITMMVFHVR